MADYLAHLRGGGAWSFTALLSRLDGLLDEEHRPLGERRAASAAKAQVPMVLEACPYADSRRGHPMNVSALAQVTAHLRPVLDELGAFRASLPGGMPPWRAALCTVLDQLSRPAVHVLTGTGPLPAGCAVAYKLAEGFFSAVRRILAEDAKGVGPLPTASAMVDFIHQQRLLHGESEVCAGSPPLIEKVAHLLLEGLAGAPLPASPRPALADVLADQVVLGVAWELFDGCAEEALLARLEGVRARNAFMVDRLADGLLRVRAASPTPPEAAARALDLLPPPLRAPLASAVRLHAGAPLSTTPATPALEALAALGEGALLPGPALAAELARRFATWLPVRSSVQRAQHELERKLRRLLALDERAPISPSGLMMPASRALAWYEAVLGHALVTSEVPATPASATLRSARRSVEVSLEA